ncbi:3110_t:CDS:2, partial [Funneliformis geosporum]
MPMPIQCFFYALSDGNTSKDRANHYYVKFTSSSFHSSVDHIDAQHANFHKEINKLGINVIIKDVFKRYANGISIETDERHVKRIAKIEHVESVDVVKIHKRINPNKNDLNKRAENYTILLAPNSDINSAHKMTGVKRVHEELRLSGKGIKVGIIDSGIDYTHPALGGCYGPGCRVAFGYNFIDDNDDPYDNCDGHGTHVAAIVGSDLRGKNPGFVGVAPDVTFGAYKVLPCKNRENEHQANDITIMKAVLKAVDDGMDVINMSLGGFGDTKNVMVMLINDLAKYKGIIFVAAIGNDGRNGLFSNLIPAIAQHVIGVCSFETNEVINFKAFDSKNPKFVINYITKNVSPFPFKKAKIKLLPNKCLNDYKKFKNSIIIQDNRVKNECPKAKDILDKMKILGKFIIINKYNLGAFPVPPTALLNAKEADILIQYLEKNPNLELDFSDKYGYTEPHPFAETPSVFSGWGLTDELDIKPEICGPGSSIFSATPVNISPYNLNSGTSMASPYIAGIAALYTEVFKEFRNQNQQQFPEQLKTALMNYAIPRKERNNLLASVLHQGAGLVDAFNMLKATSFAYPSKINLNDTVHFNGNHKLTIYNADRKEMKYKLSHLPAPSVNGYNKTFVRDYYHLEYFTRQSASVKFDNDQIAVPPGSSVEVSVTFMLPKGLPKDKHYFYSGWLEIIPLDENKPKLTVPYADDARSLPIFQTPKFPALANSNNSIITKEDPVKTFTLKLLNITIGLYDYPYIHLNLSTPTRMLISEVLDVNHNLLLSSKSRTYIPKDTLKYPIKLSWDGFSQGELISKGEYFFKLKALKMFGNINDEKDYEVW